MLAKNSSDFHGLDVKKFSSFFTFRWKHPFYKMWIFLFDFLEKEYYCLKEKIELNFSKSSPWKSNEFFASKICLKKMGKKIATLRILSGFFKKLRRTCFLNFVVDAQSIEKIHWIFQPMSKKLSKNLNFRILFRFCSKNSYFFTL